MGYRYSVGDYVLIRPDLKGDFDYSMPDGSILFCNDAMRINHAGTLQKIYALLDLEGRYKLEHNYWVWGEPMFVEEVYYPPEKDELVCLIEDFESYKCGDIFRVIRAPVLGDSNLSVYSMNGVEEYIPIVLLKLKEW